MAEIINGATDILGGSVIRYNLNVTTPNQAVIRKIIAGAGISISSTGVDPGTGDVTISISTNSEGEGESSGNGSPVGTVTSVNFLAPEGMYVEGVPITTAGTISLKLSSGYVIPLYTDIQNALTGYNKRIVALAVTGTSVKTLTLTRFEGTTISTSWTDLNIYTADGSLSANRSLNVNGYSLTFSSLVNPYGLVITVNGNVLINTNTDSNNFKLDVAGSARVSSILTVGGDTVNTSHIRGTGSSSLVWSASNFSNSVSLAVPTGTTLVSPVGSYSGLTGYGNTIFGWSPGSSLTSGTNNVLLGNSVGSGLTTGFGNVIVGSSYATNFPSSASRVLHFVNGYLNGDASTIPTSPHVFIGGGSTSGPLQTYYFGQMPFTSSASTVPITFYAPSGSGSNIGGADFTIAAGRGTGNATPGDFIISTASITTSGSTLQTLTERFKVKGASGDVIVVGLSGTGDRFVVVDSTGKFITATIGSGLSYAGGVLSATGGTAGTLTGSGTAGKLAKFNSASDIGDSIVTESTGQISVAGTLTANSIIRSGGTASQFLKADGSVDSSSYLKTGDLIIDYDVNITGSRNSTNKVFTTSQNFQSGSTRVFINGIRLTKGASYDYSETASNQITFTNAPDTGDLIVIDYLKA